MGFEQARHQLRNRMSNIKLSDFSTITPNGTVLNIGAARFVGISAIFTLAWCLLYTSTVIPAGLPPCASGPNVRLVFQITIVFSVFVGWTAPRLISSAIVHSRFSAAAAFLFLLGSLAMRFSDGNLWLFFAGAVAMGVAFSWIMFLWGCIFRFLDTRQASRVIMLSLVLGAFAFLVIAFLAQPMSFIVFALLPFISIAMAFSCMKELPGKPHVINAEHHVGQSRDLVRFAALFSFVCGYALHQQASADSGTRGTILLFFAVVIVFAIFLFADSVLSDNSDRRPLQLAVAALAAIGGLLAIDLLPPGLEHVALSLVAIATLMVDTLFWSELATMEGETHRAAFKLFCKNLLCIQVGKLAGICLGIASCSPIGRLPYASALSPLLAYAIIICIFAIWWLNARKVLKRTCANTPHVEGENLAAAEATERPRVASGASAQKPAIDTQHESGDSPSDASHQQRIGAEAANNALLHEIASSRKLTPREEEILGFLARGRNASYIQEKLVLSLGTAKTHIRHIYRKLDVHSKQELLDFLESYPHPDN